MIKETIHASMIHLSFVLWLNCIKNACVIKKIMIAFQSVYETIVDSDVENAIKLLDA